MDLSQVHRIEGNDVVSADQLEQFDNERLYVSPINQWHYYILTTNPTAVMSDFRHFPVACTTLWFFFKRRKLGIG